MKTIWKYTLDLETNKVDLPSGARVLSAGHSQGDVAIWALVDPDRPTTRRTFLVAGTGWPILDSAIWGSTFIGTVNIREFIWHVFEIFLRSDLQ